LKIVLIGFMCSGKSKVGRLLAQKYGWPHADTDEIIAKEAGMPIADIIKKQGETVFREIEKKVVKTVAETDHIVISTGGGVPLNSENMAELQRNSEVIWLKVSPETVMKRAGNLKSRPLINPERPLESIQSLLDARIKFYQMAKHQIDTDSLVPAAIVEKILTLIPLQSR